jgi:hypothetical protein
LVVLIVECDRRFVNVFETAIKCRDSFESGFNFYGIGFGKSLSLEIESNASDSVLVAAPDVGFVLTERIENGLKFFFGVFLAHDPPEGTRYVLSLKERLRLRPKKLENFLVEMVETTV